MSCVAIASSGLKLVTGGHDSRIKVWDLRALDASQNNEAAAAAENDAESNETKPLMTLENVHQKKYDEGVQGMAIHPSQPFLASGGADSIIQIFEMLA